MSIVDQNEVARWKAENAKRLGSKEANKGDGLTNVLLESRLDKLALSKFLEYKENGNEEIKFTAEGYEGPLAYDNKSGYVFASYDDSRTGRAANGRFAYDQNGITFITRLNGSQVYEIERILRANALEIEGR